ncbi:MULTISPECIES: rhomboid family intramembrane serine protease [Photobacterium]|uniref:Protease n=1 Tax=Photobacterium ganghwense TaxID=320778 RepID=A0A0J1HES5_9GAMM|nr:MULTISPECIES: rhomboid family intramembrane serine protease [Photobacterium]KLV10139.1 protease [Photobacterium ganghwense]MBV1843454.1 rhomboid family intramembrane serine protease [Photobacterium ganghwense]PSU05385.1 rhomboid family intramembrane serine protease [Photobacterium ganghwense]QSV17240.1 rhomboid family intramembrane serine protease [Photobacterium ganghwense]
MQQKDKDAFKFIALIVVICVVAHIVNVMTGGYLSGFGLLPRHYTHFTGMAAYPFLHGSWQHLLSNMLSFSVLALLVSRFGLARLISVFMISWAGSGLGVWIFGRMHYHIGLSGIIYGLWAYLLVYAVMYRSVKALLIAVVVIFLYGSMIWGFVPVHEWISYESHLFGGLSGALAGLWYAKRDKRFKER